MSRRSELPPAERLAILAPMIESGEFNQLRYARRVLCNRDTARRDLRKFMQAHPWQYRYSHAKKAYERIAP